MTQMENSEKKGWTPKKIVPILLGLVLLGGLAFGVKEYLYFKHYETTDDAEVDGDISPVAARAGGYVTEIRFRDNQQVRAGDTLVILDDRDYQIRVEQAEAALEATRAGVQVSRSQVSSVEANIPPAQANVTAARVKVWKANQDYNRYQNLLNDHAITESQFDAVKAEKEAAEAELLAARNEVSAIGKQIGASRQEVSASQANIALRKAELDFAQLQSSYTIITAPISGTVSKRNIEPGQLVQSGQILFSIVSDTSIYVTANYKETQLAKIRAGQKVDISVDAYPGQGFKGVVANFGGATGAKFSLLPPDNATGNFVKVVQRIPIRIDFLGLDQKWKDRLKPGLSVTANIHIHG